MALIENGISAIVITAQSFNPTIFNESWLTSHEVIKAEELKGPRIFLPHLAQFQTDESNIFVLPDKMQVAFQFIGNKESLDSKLNIVSQTVRNLPETPFQAIGMNFNYVVTAPEGKAFAEFNKTLLGTGDYKLIAEFSSTDSMFGRYFSKDYLDYRLKLNILPIALEPDKQLRLQFSFNFHRELGSIDAKDRARVLREKIEEWKSLREYSEKLVHIGASN